jgi:hypothetical protein
MGGGKGKKKVREWKILKQSHIWYNIMFGRCWILAENISGRESVSNGEWGLIWLKNDLYQEKAPWTINIHF